jgi:hypothetical protein
MRVRVCVVLAAICWIIIPAFGQAPATPSTPQSVAWTEHYRRATISFGLKQTIDGTDTFKPIATGVIICADAHHAFLVTAKHVFSDPERNWAPTSLQVRFSNQEKESLTEELGVSLNLIGSGNEPLWTALKDGSDIAAIPLPQSFFGHVTDCVGFQDFANEDDVYDGATVFTFGFPTDMSALGGPNGLVRAVTRSGTIAWTDPGGVLDNPLLLDSTVLPGNSGGPAFKVPSGLSKAGGFVIGGRVAFLGIVTSALVESVQVGGKPLQIQTQLFAPPVQAEVAGVGALGRVEPAAKVKALVLSIAPAQSDQ